MLTQSPASLSDQGTLTGYALAHPLLADQAYAEKLPELDFNISIVIRHYSEAGRLQYALSDMPPEFDTASEPRYDHLFTDADYYR